MNKIFTIQEYYKFNRALFSALSEYAEITSLCNFHKYATKAYNNDMAGSFIDWSLEFFTSQQDKNILQNALNDFYHQYSEYKDLIRTHTDYDSKDLLKSTLFLLKKMLNDSGITLLRQLKYGEYFIVGSEVYQITSHYPSNGFIKTIRIGVIDKTKDFTIQKVVCMECPVYLPATQQVKPVELSISIKEK